MTYHRLLLTIQRAARGNSWTELLIHLRRMMKATVQAKTEAKTVGHEKASTFMYNVRHTHIQTQQTDLFYIKLDLFSLINAFHSAALQRQVLKAEI